MNKEIEVTFARLHGPIFIPGQDGKSVGNYKETLSPNVEGPDRNLKMYLQSNGLLLLTKGVEVFIPLANVTHMVLKPTPKAK